MRIANTIHLAIRLLIQFYLDAIFHHGIFLCPITQYTRQAELCNLLVFFLFYLFGMSKLLSLAIQNTKYPRALPYALPYTRVCETIEKSISCVNRNEHHQPVKPTPYSYFNEIFFSSRLTLKNSFQLNLIISAALLVPDRSRHRTQTNTSNALLTALIHSFFERNQDQDDAEKEKK